MYGPTGSYFGIFNSFLSISKPEYSWDRELEDFQLPGWDNTSMLNHPWIVRTKVFNGLILLRLKSLHTVHNCFNYPHGLVLGFTVSFKFWFSFVHQLFCRDSGVCLCFFVCFMYLIRLIFRIYIMTSAGLTSSYLYVTSSSSFSLDRVSCPYKGENTFLRC